MYSVAYLPGPGLHTCILYSFPKIFSNDPMLNVIGMERVLGIDLGVRVFAPQYPTRKGRVLGQLWYLPVSKTILIDLKLDT